MTENTIDGARSGSGNTTWQVLADGTLREYSKDSYAFTLSKADTTALYQLLERNRSLILGEKANEEITLQVGQMETPTDAKSQGDTTSRTTGKV